MISGNPNTPRRTAFANRNIANINANLDKIEAYVLTSKLQIEFLEAACQQYADHAWPEIKRKLDELTNNKGTVND